MTATDPTPYAIEHVNGSAPADRPPAAHHHPTRAERRAADAEAKARRAEILDKAKRDRARRDEEWAAEREESREKRAATRKAATESARSAAFVKWQARLRRWWHAFVLVGAIVGVNIVAVVGQVTAFTNSFGWDVPQALATAAVIESIAIYVGWHAHVALIEGDSVLRLRLTSYAIAAGVGVLNYHHYAPDWKPGDTAVMFGAASMLSPWLWAMHSRHQHRIQLREDGLIDPRAPKFSALRWLLHRAETWEALKWAVRHSEQSPSAAIVAIQTDATTAESDALLGRARDHLVAAQMALIRAQSDALAVIESVTSETTAAADEVNAPAPVECPPEIAAQPATLAIDPPTPPVAESDQGSDRERPDEQDNREAEKWIRAAMRKGRTPTLSEIRKKFPYSQGWARLRVQAARDEMTAKGYRFLPGNVVQPPTDADSLNGAESDREEVSEVTA